MFSQSTCFRRFEWPKGEINIEYVYALKCIWKTLNSSSCCCYCIQLSFAPITCQLSLWNVQKPHIDALGWCYDVGCSFLFKNHAKIRCQWCWCRRRDVSRWPHSKHWLLARRILCVCMSVCVCEWVCLCTRLCTTLCTCSWCDSMCQPFFVRLFSYSRITFSSSGKNKKADSKVKSYQIRVNIFKRERRRRRINQKKHVTFHLHRNRIDSVLDWFSALPLIKLT